MMDRFRGNHGDDESATATEAGGDGVAGEEEKGEGVFEKEKASCALCGHCQSHEHEHVREMGIWDAATVVERRHLGTGMGA